MEQKFSAYALNYSFWIEYIDINILKSTLEKLITDSGHTIRSFSEEWFTDKEHTCAFILGESHAVSHSYKLEANAIYLEITSCSPIKYEKFIDNVRKSDFKILKEFKFNKSL